MVSRIRPSAIGRTARLWRAGTPAPPDEWGRSPCLPFAGIQRYIPAILCGVVLGCWTAKADTIDDLYRAIGGLDQGRRADVQAILATLDTESLNKLCLTACKAAEDDAVPLMAVHAYAIFASEPGHAERADTFTTAAANALKSSSATPAGRKFLIRQLAFSGGAKAVSAVVGYLDDPEYADAAIATARSIGAEGGVAALRAALGNSGPQTRGALIAALGALRDRESVTPLLQIVRRSDGDDRAAALAALANIGDARALQTLLDAPASGSERFDRAEHDALLLTFARRLAERPDPGRESIRRIYDALSGGDPGPVQSSTVCAALSVYADAFGPAAMPDVLKAMSSADDALRSAALRIARRLPGTDVSAALADALGGGSAALRAAVLGVLGERGDTSVREAVVGALADPDETVRGAAIAAAISLGGSSGVNGVIGGMKSATDTDRTALTRALQELDEPEADASIASALRTASPALKPALIDALARRGAREQLPGIQAQLEGDELPVRVAALRALGDLADQGALKRLLEALVGARDDSEAAAAEDAVVAICSRAGENTSGLSAVLQSANMHDETAYARVLAVLGRLGGDAALRALRNTKDDPRSEIREAAVRALGRWPDGSAEAGRLAVDLAGAETDERIHVLALRALGHILVTAEGRDVTESVALAQKGIEVARRAEEKKLLIARLAGIANSDSLRALRSYLNDTALRTDAASAILRVAAGLLPGGWAEARAAVDELEKLDLSGAVKSRIDEVSKRIGEQEGFITDWLVAGPFTQPGKNGMELFDVPFKPEPGVGGELKWIQQPVTTDPARYWFIDINANPEIRGDNRAAYLQTYIYSDADQPARLELGSDDGIKAWVNDKVILSNNVPRGCEPAQDIVDIQLTKGRNRVLLKITNGGGGFAACARVRSPDGGPIKKVRIDAGTE